MAENLNGYKKILLDILKFFHNFCIKNNLRYFAVGGTFLGAVRHKGFIPWDDDIDVCMPRNDYQKFISLMKLENGKYILETPDSEAEDFCYTQAKLYDSSTTVLEKIKANTNRGVFIDVFPLDGIGNNKNEINRNYFAIDILNMFLASRLSVIRKERKLWKNLAIFVSNLLPSCFVNEKKIIKKLDRLCAKRNFEHYNYCGLLLTQYRKKYIMPKSWFDEYTDYTFEDTLIRGVKDYEKYLSHLYGDWRKLPPENQRNSGHDLIIVNLNKSYLER